jgi:hypothetical protein
MNALGGISYSSYELYTRQYEQALASDVSTVSDSEAQNGASQSDSVRFAAREQSKEDSAVPFSTYVKRAVQFGQTIKKEAGKKDGDQKCSTCPIEKARAESLVGENAPLNWLVADQMGGQASVPTREDFVNRPEIDFQDPAAIFSPEPFLEASSGGTLLSQEWLLTPCI